MRQALICAALLMVLGCAKKSETGVFVDPAFPSLVPSDTTLLAGFRLDQIKTAPLYRKYAGEIDIAQLNEFSRRTGLDPLHDIGSVLIAYDGKESIAIARGHFSADQLTTKLAGIGASRTVYKKYMLIGSGRDAVMFIHEGLAVAGPESSLRSLIDIRDRSDTGIPQDLQTRLKSLPKDDQIYVVSSAGIPLSAFPSRSDVQSSLSNIVGFINGLTAGLAIDEGVHLSADIDCISDAGAKRVNDALRGAIG
ncbi:MAG TPA: hypothetical protein VG168_11020, partial [Bryobacteraceae bacterium]|nr:hypothetical protein [Bryobacteraceae bacterium]